MTAGGTSSLPVSCVVSLASALLGRPFLGPSWVKVSEEAGSWVGGPGGPGHAAGPSLGEPGAMAQARTLSPSVEGKPQVWVTKKEPHTAPLAPLPQGWAHPPERGALQGI